MTQWMRIGCFLGVVVGLAFGNPVYTQEAAPVIESATPTSSQLTAEEIRALLDSIDPYKPDEPVSGEIDIFGSTSMDVLAHGWANEFKKFHSDVTLEISAEGSETVVDRLSKNPNSIGMLSRPVSKKDLETLKSAGMKHPVAVQVGRDPLGVFVHKSNPLETITYPQLVALFCSEEPTKQVSWSTAGISGDLADKPIRIIGRDKKSGTRAFIETYLFHLDQMRQPSSELGSNSEVLQTVSTDKQAIAISEFKFGNASVRRLKLRDKSGVVAGDEHEILLGKYPITRPLTLVFDLEGAPNRAAANREFVRYALTQSGQANTILAGFFPYDPPTLRAEISKLSTDTDDSK